MKRFLLTMPIILVERCYVCGNDVKILAGKNLKFINSLNAKKAQKLVVRIKQNPINFGAIYRHLKTQKRYLIFNFMVYSF